MSVLSASITRKISMQEVPGAAISRIPSPGQINVNKSLEIRSPNGELGVKLVGLGNLVYWTGNNEELDLILREITPKGPIN